MPLYEYQCDHCGRFELIKKFSDAPLTACPRCGRTVQKLFSAPAIQFKGSGWYVTDYARKSAGDGASPAAAKDSPKDSSTPTDSTPRDSSASSGGSPTK